MFVLARNPSKHRPLYSPLYCSLQACKPSLKIVLAFFSWLSLSPRFVSVKQGLESSQSKHIFVKDMAYSVTIAKAHKFFARGFKHTFLIRNPFRALASWRKAMIGQLPGLEEKGLNEEN